MHISSYPPVWTTRPANEPGRYDLASAIRIRTGAHSFEGKVFNASACKNKRVPKPLDDMGASSAAIVTGQVFDVSMPAGEVEEAKEVASRKVSSAGRPLVIVQLAQIIGRWMDDGPAPFFASMAL